MPESTLLVARDGAVTTITVNRPDKLNALNAATIDDLRRALLEVRRDDAVRAIVLTGAGPKAFVAGADIRELAALDPAGARVVAERGQHVFDLVEHLGKPVVAAINGFALGGGLRARDGVHDPRRCGHGAARSAGDQPGTHPGLRRDAAPGPARRARPGPRTAAHR